ncbi:MAG TPA: hypothetical protein VFB81_06205, partial [Myxococcales bacterium]|nr:hypothetical protein [Myxococcales bacterium]
LRLDTVDLNGQAVGISRLQVTADGVFALDAAAQEPVLLHLTHDGRLVERLPAPAEQQSLLANLVSSRAGLALGKTTVQIAVDNHLVGLEVLGRNGRDHYVMVDELKQDRAGTIHIDRIVRQYTPAGRLAGMARFPIGEQAVPVEQALAVGPDGQVYGLLAQADRVLVARLSFMPRLVPILPEDSFEPVAPQLSLACTTYRSTIASRANAYINNSHYLSSTNISGACAGRIKPRYLYSAGNYYSVSYDWNGFDSVSGFNSYMSPGTSQAGDIDTAGSEGCSKGVDCSGFVSRAWGLPQKYGTGTLPSLSTAISWASLKVGDILDKPGVHVVLIVTYTSTSSAYVWEATTTGSFDRVVKRTINPGTYLAGYTAYRFNTLCDP